MTTTDVAAVARRVRRARGLSDVKRRALLAALKHDGLVRARLTASGVLLEGPGGIVTTHLSGGNGGESIGPLLRDLRRVGLA